MSKFSTQSRNNIWNTSLGFELRRAEAFRVDDKAETCFAGKRKMTLDDFTKKMDRIEKMYNKI